MQPHRETETEVGIERSEIRKEEMRMRGGSERLLHHVSSVMKNTLRHTQQDRDRRRENEKRVRKRKNEAE